MDPRVGRTRHAVLDSARELMLETGLDAVTHLQVAERSGVARRTLYRHWPTRGDLLHDVLAGASYPTYTRTGDVRTDVRAHLRQLRDALVDGPLALVVMALAERSRTDPDLAALREELVEAGCAPLRELLEDARRSGELATVPDDPDTLVAEIEGPLFYVVCVRGQVPTDELLEDLVRRVPVRGARDDDEAHQV